MVGQHDPARAHANARGPPRQIADQHRSRRTGDAVHVVVLGHPEAVVAKALDVLRQVQRVAQRLRRAGVGAYRHQVEGGNLQVTQLRHGASAKVFGHRHFQLCMGTFDGFNACRAIVLNLP
ncbi:hypothetical protein D3C76_1222330 [compost metagenome]